MAGDLTGQGGTYILKITVSDGCNVSPQADLTVNVMTPTTVCLSAQSDITIYLCH